LIEDVHSDQPVLTYGRNTSEASIVVILLHGRGSSAQEMIPLASAIDGMETAFLIPNAAQKRWYPNSAFDIIEKNEPDLSSALAKIDRLVDEAVQQTGSKERIVLGGFSQGACLAATYMARHAVRFGGLFVLSGALIGPPEAAHDYSGSLENVPVFIGGSDVDPWMPHEYMARTADVFRSMQAKVDFRTYPGMTHTVIQDEIDAIREWILSV
jgi:predicted esterase